MATTDKDLATTGEVFNAFTPTPILAGDIDIVTEEATVVSGAGVCAKYTVMGRITASGKLTKLTPGASDGSQIAYGVLSQAVDATSADQKVGVIIGGFLNDAALVWPTGTAYDTLIERQAAFVGSLIRIGTVRL